MDGSCSVSYGKCEWCLSHLLAYYCNNNAKNSASIGDQKVYSIVFQKTRTCTIKSYGHTLSFVYHCHIWKELFSYATIIFYCITEIFNGNR